MFTSELNNRMLRDLGKNGTLLKLAQGTVTGNWIKITCIADASVNIISDWENAASPETVALVAGQSIFGTFTSITVASGTVVAY